MNFLFGFNGRVRRTSYFLGSVVANIVCGVILVSLLLTGLHVNGAWSGGDWETVAVDWAPNLAMGLLGLMVGVAAFWISLALAVKRWHDVGVTGWFALTAWLPGANFAVFVLLCLLPGTEGANRFGPSPRRDDLLATA